MKRVRINVGKVGLVFRGGDYQRVITAGVHWLKPFEKVENHNMGHAFRPTCDLNLLLQDEALTALLHVVEVGDNELVLLYTDGNFQRVLTAGKYAFWKTLIDLAFTKVDLTKIDITEGVDLLTLKRKELVPYVRVCKVESYEQGVLFVDKKVDRMLSPGDYYFWKNAQEVSVSTVDLRQAQLEVSGQEILTKDKATLRITFYAQYKVVDVTKAVVENKDYQK